MLSAHITPLSKTYDLFAFIYSYLTYCLVTWGLAANVHVHKILVL